MAQYTILEAGQEGPYTVLLLNTQASLVNNRIRVWSGSLPGAYMTDWMPVVAEILVSVTTEGPLPPGWHYNYLGQAVNIYGQVANNPNMMTTTYRLIAVQWSGVLPGNLVGLQGKNIDAQPIYYPIMTGRPTRKRPVLTELRSAAKNLTTIRNR